MSKLEHVIRVAWKTFAQRSREATQTGITNTVGSSADSCGVKFQSLFSELLGLVKNVTGEDLGVPAMLRLKSSIRHHRPTALYSEVFGNSSFLVCIFILYPKSRIPLHSHPGMYGILKVVEGEVIVRSYTPLTKVDFSRNTIPPFEGKETCTSMDENSPPAVVTPDNNLHEIINLRNEAAVFLDILSPPYTGENCYFSANSKTSNGSHFEIRQTNCPDYFHTITIPFPYEKSISHLSRPDLA